MSMTTLAVPPALALPTTLDNGPFAVSTRGLVKRFGRQVALDGVDIAVPQGAVYVLAGENGAGKSTLFHILLNLVRPTAGDARLLDLDPRKDGPLARAQVGYVPEYGDFGLGWMRVDRVLAHQAAFHPTWDHDYATRLSRQLELRLDARMGKLSKGQARRVQLVMALAHRPPVLLLDEPTDGLDPVARDEVMGLLAGHVAETGCTIVVSTHTIHEVDRLADHVGVLSKGRLLAQVGSALLQRMLRLYRIEVPPGWTSPPDPPGLVLRRGEFGRELQWTVWGEEREVAERLAQAGATVRAVTPLRLDEAVITILRAKEPS